MISMRYKKVDRQGDAKTELIKSDDPTSTKRTPSENRGPNLKFLQYFVRYQSTYELE
jgi:hypothetical protein